MESEPLESGIENVVLQEKDENLQVDQKQEAGVAGG